jgi:iron-sulfur cluster assembly accessory protein
MIHMTDRAIAKVRALIQAQPDFSQRLRIWVETGGCSGFEYGMKLDAPRDGDVIAGPADASVIIDAVSLEKIQGAELDFDDGLQGTGFRVVNPNARETCGCGRSFS